MANSQAQLLFFLILLTTGGCIIPQPAGGGVGAACHLAVCLIIHSARLAALSGCSQPALFWNAA